jgi:hypothetical protein
MSTITYQRVLGQAERLSPNDQLRLLEELAASVRRRVLPGKRRSIMELEGLGQEIWQGIDAQEYVNRERDAWGGLSN